MGIGHSPMVIRNAPSIPGGTAIGPRIRRSHQHTRFQVPQDHLGVAGSAIPAFDHGWQVPQTSHLLHGPGWKSFFHQ
jgi:hypothetical protein